MRKLFFALLTLVPLFCYAGRETLADGKTSVYWEDCTAPVAYTGYRVEVRLTDVYTKNVWGTVSLFLNGRCVDTKNFMITAGDCKANVDFDNLVDGTRYEVKVSVRGK